LCHGDGIRDCGRDREINISAVNSAERVVGGASIEVDA